MNREQQCLDTLKALVKYPNSTSLELNARSGLDRHLIARRLPDLLEQGLVHRDSDIKRPCRSSVTAHISFAWFPTRLGIKTAQRELETA